MNKTIARLRQTPAQYVILIFIFIPAVFSALVYMGVTDVSGVQWEEKKTLTARPVFDSINVGKFIREFDSFFVDRLWFRPALIRAHTLLELKLFQTSPAAKVIVGKDGWLYYRSELEGDGNTIADYEGRVPFTAKELALIKTNIKTNASWCKQRGILLFVIIVPNKETVYSEFLPAYIRSGGPGRREQLMRYLQNSDLPVLDLTDALMNGKKNHELYYRGGTHWNQYGAFLGYRAASEWISHEFPALRPLPLSAFHVAVDEHSATDHWFGLKENREIRLTLKEPIASTKTTLSAIAFRDSYIKECSHFYTYHFNPFVQLSNRAFNQQSIAAQQPDIVIWEMVERSIDILLYMK